MESESTADAVGDFEHAQLPPHHFRLLHLLEIDEDGQLICELHQVSLEANPNYDAISYAWNDEVPSLPIICNAKRLLVTPSLRGALLAICDLGQDHALWVDAICINQGDDVEKSLQVPLMREFYSKAKRVLVWLGESGEFTDQVVDSIEYLVQQLSSVPTSILVDDYTLRSHHLPSQEDDVWKGVGDLLSRGWFRRLWILQEVALGYEVIALCGSKSVAWEQLWSLIDSMNRAGAGGLAFRGRRSAALGFSTMSLLHRIKTGQGKVEGFSLRSLCSDARYRNTSEPIDKIYALFGLTSDPVRSYIAVDYSPESRQNYWKTYMNATIMMLREDPTLSVLQMVPSLWRPTGLPSWCPNFDSLPPTIEFSNTFRAGGRGDTRDSSDPRLFLESVLSDEPRIRMQGNLVDEVSETVSFHWTIFLPFDDEASLSASRALSWLNECRSLAEPLEQSPGFPDDLARTIVANNLNLRRRYVPGFQELQQSIVNMVSFLEKSSSSTVADLDGESLRSAQQCLEAVNLACAGRKLFRTKEHRLGLGPAETMAGDQLYVFRGANVLFLFRQQPDGETVSLVGDSYVHGLMHGESIQRAEEAGEAPVVLTIE